MAAATRLYLVFFISGFAGLMHEAMWSRFLERLLGSAATAQTLVLALFMGGMGLGALWASHRAKRIHQPILAYAMIEAVVGVYALAFPVVFEAMLEYAYGSLFVQLGPGWPTHSARWALAACAILPPCVALGASFPLLGSGLLRAAPTESGRILSRLYFVNGLGAALGALATGYLFVPVIGLNDTARVAGAINLVCTLMVVFVLRRSPEASSSAPVVTAGSPEDRDHRFVVIALVVAFGTGLASFMYEVAWMRLLAMILGSATLSFEVMLAAFVFGMALGGWWLRQRIERFTVPLRALAMIQIVMGMSAIATLPLYRIAVLAMGTLMIGDDRGAGAWLVYNLLRFALCLLIMLPASFCAGMTLPLLTHVALRRGASEAMLGRIYGIDTIGAVLGAAIAGLIGLPLVGIRGVIVGGAMVDLGLGLLLLAFLVRSSGGQPGLRRLLSYAWVGSLSIAGLGLFYVDLDPRVLSASVFRRGQIRLPKSFEPVYYVDGRTASISVATDRERPGYHTMYTNGKPDASIRLQHWPSGRDEAPVLSGDEPTQMLVALMPLMARPQAERAALIGIGSGLTSHTLLASPNLRRLDTIEIEAEMIEAARLFHAVNHRVFDDPRSRLVVDDAKAYFAASGSVYDLLVSEPSNPWVRGVAGLFTREFYRRVRRHLAEQGVFAQWIQGYELSDKLLITVLAALHQEFADYRVYRVGGRDFLIMAVKNSDAGLGLDDKPLGWAGLRASLDLLGVHSGDQLRSQLLGDRRSLGGYLEGAPANSDGFPLLELGAERARFERDSAEFLLTLRSLPLPFTAAMTGVPRPDYPRFDGQNGFLDPGHRVFEDGSSARRIFELANAWSLKIDAHGRFQLDESVLAIPDAAELNVWLARVAGLDGGPRSWQAFVVATQQLHARFAAYVRFSGGPWWRAVQTISAREDAPASVRSFVSLLAACERLDAAAIETSLTDLRERSPRNRLVVFDKHLLQLAGQLAAVIRGLDSKPTGEGSGGATLENDTAPRRARVDAVIRAYLRARSTGL